MDAAARTARIGGVWGITIALGILGFSGTVGAAGIRGLNHPELWWSSSIPGQAQLLLETANQVSEFGTGYDNAASVVIVGLDSPALVWTLREHDVQIVDSVDITSTPDLVITPFANDPVLASAYRGQDFNWRQTPLWGSSTLNAWFRWVTLREILYSEETIILWARSDLFLDN